MDPCLLPFIQSSVFRRSWGRKRNPPLHSRPELTLTALSPPINNPPSVGWAARVREKRGRPTAVLEGPAATLLPLVSLVRGPPCFLVAPFGMWGSLAPPSSSPLQPWMGQEKGSPPGKRTPFMLVRMGEMRELKARGCRGGW